MVKIRDIELGDFPLLLAPMEDVSDPPFRAVVKEQGCDLMYTEFISVEALLRLETTHLTANMEQRGGGILRLEWLQKPEIAQPVYHQQVETHLVIRQSTAVPRS